MPGLLLPVAQTIDYGNPVNWQSPFNRGLTGWWLPLPQRMGGLKLKNLVGKYDGTLVAGAAWTGALGRPGGWGALSFDGIDDEVTTGVNGANLITASEGSALAWVRPDADTVDLTVPEGKMICGDVQDAGFWGLVFASPGPEDRVFAYNWDGNEDSVGVGYTVGEWTFLGWVHTAGTLYLYKDGIQAASVVSGNTQSLNNFSIGSRMKTGNTNFFDGYIGEVRTYNRAVTVGEFQAYQVESMRGYPTTINRIRRYMRGWSQPSGEISGTATISISPAAKLTGAGALAGSTTITISAAGTALATVQGSGTATISLFPSARLTGAGALRGSGTITISPTAKLTADAAIDGSATISLSGAAFLQGLVSISGSTTITLSAAGTVAGTANASGTATISLSPLAKLTGAGALAGASTITISPAGTLTGTGGVAGTATITISPTGTLTGAGAVAGTSTITISPNGKLTGAGALAGTSTITITGSATGTTVLRVSGPYTIGAVEIFSPGAVVPQVFSPGMAMSEVAQ